MLYYKIHIYEGRWTIQNGIKSSSADYAGNGNKK